MIIEHLEADTVGDDAGLPQRNVGEGAGMDHQRLVLCRAAKRGIDGIAHQGRHGPAHLEVPRRNRVAVPVIGHRDPVHAVPQVCQVLTMASRAISSELTAMVNLDCMVKPSIFPPMPTIMLRRLWAQKSITHPISTPCGIDLQPLHAG